MDVQFQLLLDKAEVIRLRQQVLSKTSTTDDFNIFCILRQETDEVHLHSRFLYELLNPHGSHGKGPLFLKLFAEACKEYSFPELSHDTVQVRREHANIDLLIQDIRHSIVIENKIWAGDQHEQLKRYHDYVKTLYREPHLFYLTLNGSAPSDSSTGNLQAPVHLISYAHHIDNWLTACIKEVATHPALRETLIQYQNLIRRLSGKIMNKAEEEEKRAILALLAQDGNAERAATIARNWSHVRWHTERDFWDELLASVKSRYQISEIGLVSDDAIDNMVHGNGRNPYYGFEFSIGSIQNHEVIFRLERNTGAIKYGIYDRVKDDSLREKMYKSIQQFVTSTSNWWIGVLENKQSINFYNFNYSAITQSMTNLLNRQMITQKLWQEIEAFIQEIKQAYLSEFGAEFMPS